MLPESPPRTTIDEILKHGWHCISPDSSSVEALEAVCDAQKVSSVLEIGAGVGICGIAAERRGIKDFTFVDKVYLANKKSLTSPQDKSNLINELVGLVKLIPDKLI